MIKLSLDKWYFQSHMARAFGFKPAGERAEKQVLRDLEKRAINVLSELHAFFSKYDVRIWLEQGTLIDAIIGNKVQAGTMIDAWGRPLKLGIRFQDAAPLFEHISILRGQGYDVQVHDSTIDLKKGSIKVNIKGYQLKSSDEISGILSPSPCCYLTYIAAQDPRSETSVYGYGIPHYFYESLDKIELYGLTSNTPSRVQSYLEYRYGKDWRERALDEPDCAIWSFGEGEFEKLNLKKLSDFFSWRQ